MFLQSLFAYFFLQVFLVRMHAFKVMLTNCDMNIYCVYIIEYILLLHAFMWLRISCELEARLIVDSCMCFVILLCVVVKRRSNSCVISRVFFSLFFCFYCRAATLAHNFVYIKYNCNLFLFYSR
jgi:hypothetical protein